MMTDVSVLSGTGLTGKQNTDPQLILDVQRLGVSFQTDEGWITAVEDLDFQVHRGRTLGIVGESGSGKSVSTKAVMQLLPANARIKPSSRIWLWTKNGQKLDVARLKPRSKAARQIRGGEIAMIFQEPMASFSPVYTIGNQMREAVRLHSKAGKGQALSIAREMLNKVGIANPSRCLTQYQHELSGGMRQRAMIAMALSTNPSLLIADEPTTALDVTIQAQILDLMRRLQEEMNMSIIFITHDMGVIAHAADEVAVIYLGMIMEFGPTSKIIDDPKHPYTRGLLSAIPSLKSLEHRLRPIPGDIPSPLERPRGCAFQTRCPERIQGLCDRHAPVVSALGEQRRVACFLYSDQVKEAPCPRNS